MRGQWPLVRAGWQCTLGSGGSHGEDFTRRRYHRVGSVDKGGHTSYHPFLCYMTIANAEDIYRGAPRRHLGAMLGLILEQFDGPWAILEPQWGHLGPSSRPRGPLWGLLGPSCGGGGPMHGQWPLVRAGSQCTLGSRR